MWRLRQFSLLPKTRARRGVALAALVICVAALGCSAPPEPGPSDAQLKRDVTTALDQAGLKTVVVQVKDGIAMLSGTVPDPASIDNAIQISRGVKGVKDVTSEVKVAEVLPPTPPPQPNPETIEQVLAAKIRFALDASPALGGSKIDIKVLSGVAMLTGTVPSETARTEASKIASGIKEVASVENRLEVVEVKVASVPDVELEERVQKVLDTSFGDLDLTMSVKKGMVVVRGAVHDRGQMLQIGEAIRGIDGVRGIDTSLLTVEGGEQGERIGTKSPSSS